MNKIPKCRSKSKNIKIGKKEVGDVSVNFKENNKEKLKDKFKNKLPQRKLKYSSNNFNNSSNTNNNSGQNDTSHRHFGEDITNQIKNSGSSTTATSITNSHNRKSFSKINDKINVYAKKHSSMSQINQKSGYNNANIGGNGMAVRIGVSPFNNGVFVDGKRLKVNKTNVLGGGSVGIAISNTHIVGGGHNKDNNRDYSKENSKENTCAIGINCGGGNSGSGSGNGCNSMKRKGYFGIGMKISHANCAGNNCAKIGSFNYNNNLAGGENNLNCNNVNGNNNAGKMNNIGPVRVSGCKSTFMENSKVNSYSSTVNNTKKELM